MLIEIYRYMQVIWSGRNCQKNQLIKIWRLAGVYFKLDNHIKRFRRKTNINCLKGCGKCCERVYVETAPLEMIPLAAIILKRAKSGLWIRKLMNVSVEGRCMFYRKLKDVPGKGRCLIYPLRPLTCRLFGFAAKKNKNGQKQWVTCSLLKMLAGSNQVEITVEINKGLSIPVAGSYRWLVHDIGSSAESRLLPLPFALYEAMAILSR
ncbi:MAG: YkgJ family cysteine cluster protein [Candidatus Omnitrophica bacterium]|nr:YkgJ family cysteine cluster protein [Candidatus Omnitrophota bacterium]MCB9748052.1 YkgJ family cysteine cluster protein [Candidatus Omnitrophota bacterium]